MTDIVERLLDRAYSFKAKDPLCEEAAKEIERLRRKLASIERFAETGNMFEAMFGTPVSRAGQRGTKTQNSDANCPERDNTTHDAVPEARANAESVAPPPTAGDRSGSPTSHSGTGNTSDRPQPVKDDVSDRSQPISDERLAALEELSAFDQELEARHGPQGNPMIKPQVNNHPVPYAKSDENRIFYDMKSPRNGALSGVPDPDSRVWETPRTPQTQATPPQGSVHGEGSLCDSRNAKEPVAWATFYPNGSTASVYVGRQPPHAEPLYRYPPCENLSQRDSFSLTDEEREAIKTAIGIVDWQKAYFSHLKHNEPLPSATLRKLLQRLG